MTFETLQNHVFRLMRDPNQTRYSLDFVKKWLNEAERQYCNATSYSVKKDTSITTVSGTREYDLPAGFIREIAVFEDGKPLDTCELEDTIHEGGDESGEPYAYYIENKKIGFEYKPDGAYAITLIYYSRGGEMISAADTPIIPEEHHMLLIAFACIFASIEGDDTRQTTFQRIWDRGLDEAKGDVVNLSPWPEVYPPANQHLNPATHDVEGIL